MLKPIAVWNTELKLWTQPTGDQLFAPLEPYWATWQKSGMTLNGQAFERPTLEPHINGSECSSLPTPRANEPGSTSPGYGDSLSDFAARQATGYARKDLELLRSPTASQGQGGALGEDEAKRRGNTIGIRDQAMDLAKASGLKVSRALIPTPIVSDYKNGKSSPGYGMNLPQTAKSLSPLLPTTRVSMANGPTQKEIKEGNPKKRIETEVMLGATNWGRFEPAIRRWEELIGRPAPAPTKPDGRDDAHRLSSMFTEWLMGLPEGWITGLGLKRNDELKLAGNGVVPQQAELALRILLEDDNLLERIKK